MSGPTQNVDEIIKKAEEEKYQYIEDNPYTYQHEETDDEEDQKGNSPWWWPF